MTTAEKAIRADSALRQLRSELTNDRQAPQRAAISDFLSTAPDATKARLFDIVTAPRTP